MSTDPLDARPPAGPANVTTRPRRPRESDGPLLIGLVGRAGSGKSTVARALGARGALVLDADALGHEVTDHDPDVRAALQTEYGPDIYLADGSLDRRRVAARVFSDPAALARLNQLTHPRILDRLRARVADARSAGFRGVVVIDAALMLDWGFERELDAVIAVRAPEDVLVTRLITTRGWTAEAARARLTAQRQSDAFAAAADIVLDNVGEPEDLAEAAVRAVERLAQTRRS